MSDQVLDERTTIYKRTADGGEIAVGYVDEAGVICRLRYELNCLLHHTEGIHGRLVIRFTGL